MLVIYVIAKSPVCIEVIIFDRLCFCVWLNLKVVEVESFVFIEVIIFDSLFLHKAEIESCSIIFTRNNRLIRARSYFYTMMTYHDNCLSIGYLQHDASLYRHTILFLQGLSVYGCIAARSKC